MPKKLPSRFTLQERFRGKICRGHLGCPCVSQIVEETVEVVKNVPDWCLLIPLNFFGATIVFF